MAPVDDSSKAPFVLKNKVFGEGGRYFIFHCALLQSLERGRDNEMSDDGGFVPDLYHLFNIDFPVTLDQLAGFPVISNIYGFPCN